MRSANRGDSLDRQIEEENAATQDFFILDHVEGYDELPDKTQIYFRTAIQTWDADFYFKVDDDVFINLGEHRSGAGKSLASRLLRSCRRSGSRVSLVHVTG